MDYHFESVSEVNKWDDTKKLAWLKVRLIGRAQLAFQRLPETTRASYNDTKKALKERFEPASLTERHKTELDARRKKKSEGWAEFSEDLRTLVEKAYPTLQDEARVQMALTHYYLRQLATEA